MICTENITPAWTLPGYRNLIRSTVVGVGPGRRWKVSGNPFHLEDRDGHQFEALLRTLKRFKLYKCSTAGVYITMS